MAAITRARPSRLASISCGFGWVNWMMFNYIANILSIMVIIVYMSKDSRNSNG